MGWILNGLSTEINFGIYCRKKASGKSASCLVFFTFVKHQTFDRLEMA